MKIIVDKHKLELIKTPINEQEVNVTQIEFEFDEDMQDMVKEAYFTLNDNSYKVIIQNNQCNIPSEVLTQKGTIEIGVVCFEVQDEEVLKRYNPSPVYVDSWTGSLKEADNSEPITPSEMEQFEAQLQQGLDNIQEAIENAENLDINAVKTDNKTTITITKQDETQQVVEILDGAKGDKGDKGDKGEKGDRGQQGEQGIQGIKGDKGDTGEPFVIKKTYPSVADMNADFDNMNVGDYVMIATSVEVQDNAKLYTKTTTEWIFITDFSGATGIQGEKGEQGEQGIQGIQGIQGVKGDKGDTGNTGNGISSITKTSTSGLVDTYTITYTDGTTTTYQVTNGEDGEVTQEQLDEVIAENTYLNSVINQLPKVSGSGTSVTLDNTIQAKLTNKLSPSEMTQEDTPTPSTPQDIHTISGDNTLVVGNKNLIKSSYATAHCSVSGNDITITSSGTDLYLAGGYGATYPTLFTIPAGTYYALCTNSKAYITIYGIYDGETTIRGISSSGTTLTSTLYVKGIRIRSTDGSTNLQNQVVNLYLGTENSYEPHQEQTAQLNLGDLEYSAIGDYKDEFMKPSGKNLFDKDNANILNNVYIGSSTLGTSNGAKTLYISCKPSTTYTISRKAGQRFIIGDTSIIPASGVSVSNRTADNTGTTLTITTSANSQYIVVFYYLSSADTLTEQQILDSIMINEGTTALPYEPYNNNKWYLKKNIGKIVLDGSEDNWNNTFGTNLFQLPSFLNTKPFIVGYGLSNYYKYNSVQSGINANTENGDFVLQKSGADYSLFIKNTDYSTPANFKTWLSTHNTIVDYILATPQYILLNDTLQEQLDIIESKLLSYKGQTNISQVNNDLPFVINSSALKDLSTL